MPDFNPANPGDLVYPKYAAITTEPISAALQIIKGQLYTTDSSGNLIVVTTTLQPGFFQALVTPVGVSGAAGADSVQVAGPRTRMMFTTQIAGLNVGEDVKIVTATTNVVTSTKADLLHIGKIFEIYNLQSDNITPKHVTAVGDKVIVETVQA